MWVDCKPVDVEIDDVSVIVFLYFFRPEFMD